MTNISASPTSGMSNVFAILLAITLAVPAYFLASLVVYIYTFISNVGMGSNSGGSWIPFLDGIFKLVWQVAAPEFIRGVVTAGSSVWLSLFFLKKANRQTVSMAAVAVFITVTVIVGAMYLAESGPGFYFFFTVASFCIGLGVGGWAAIEAA